MDYRENGTNNQQDSILQPGVKESRHIRLLKTLVGLAIIYTLYLAKSLLIPLFFSALVALLLSPLVRIARRFFIPPSLSAAALMLLLVTPFTLLGLELAEPAQRWMQSLPKIAAEVTQEIEEISDSLKQGAELTAPEPAKENTSFFSWFDDEEEPEPKPNDGNTMTDRLKQSGIELGLTILSSAPLLLAQIFGCLILIFFLLVFGPNLFNVFIRDFPIVTNKRRALVLVNHIQRELSAYIITISMINGLLGVATAIAFTFLGVQDAILWGALVALLNFVPYLGGLISCSILLVAGLVQFGLVSAALLPAFVFLGINIFESQLATPTVLGRSLRLNPVIIILWLSITGWLWGIVGVLIAVPILMSFKIILSNLGALPHWVKFIESK
ncbi:AI-2E family transporter [Alteromonas confluentis]|uniref:AI-2E family transporter n=1 Tax=Alteromonas confluentis TaxID=1656094 RepID=A0A1E7ZEH9_9ALTE|nr:AI-2E family transporter [Alteromonas confluentis]OFC71938.1 AI-2E family transporter [Alteromonas confluentis]